MTSQEEFDIAVVGGGLHGVSIATEAASRGLKVVLLQGNDLANGPTANLRSVLRGGIRKLENLRLDLVNGNLREIALLRKKAPHLIKPLKFQVVPNSALRSQNRVQRGLALYNFLQKRQLKKAGLEDKIDAEPQSLSYFEYQLSNARLIFALAQQAQHYGASIRPRTQVVSADRLNDHWALEAHDKYNDRHYSLKAKILVNCCGWLAENFLNEVLKVTTRCGAKISYYGQLFVRKPERYPGNFVFQLSDGRLLYTHSVDDQHFAIGALFAKNDTEEAKFSAIEQALSMWNSHTGNNLQLSDVAHSNWTTRAKPEDPLSNDNGIYRESLLDLNNPGKSAPLLNLFGMNTTNYRLIAEQALEILEVFTGKEKNADYSRTHLPGGDEIMGLNAFFQDCTAKIPQEDFMLFKRWVDSYGTLAKPFIEALQNQSLGKHFGHGLYEIELQYLKDKEWALCADDVLWRRSLLGLRFNESEKHAINEWFTANLTKT